MEWKNKNILVTGGTGSFGKKLIEVLLGEHYPGRIVVYSRDELKQFEMQNDPRFADAERLRFFIGDVRDKDRMARAFDGIDVVVHAAALKQVPAAEYNPFEAIKTNVHGAQNVIDCAIDRGVKRVIALSTDKAANPINLYGATKLCSDKLFVAGNAYAGARDVAFSVVRYGNVVGSRGSVVPFFLAKRKEGVLPITDPRMTRFWITLEQGVRFVIDCLNRAKGGELFVPKIPSMKMPDLARVIAPEAEHKVVGIRPGEKLHEVMVTEDDARNTLELGDRYVILPPDGWQRHEAWHRQGRPCTDGFRYASDTNDRWLDEAALRKMIADLDLPEAREWAAERGLG
ncbi:MAG: UDP-N-acetylglucosamine 4,6-dehydratase (inverting) [Deltaproteobacteria bacterium]|nr:UDP-N-acetylglucosamine 4,6-dehydratase (inverting) [Deltaproteobacteria bacterium]